MAHLTNDQLRKLLSDCELHIEKLKEHNAFLAKQVKDLRDKVKELLSG